MEERTNAQVVQLVHAALPEADGKLGWRKLVSAAYREWNPQVICGRVRASGGKRERVLPERRRRVRSRST